MRSPAGSVRPGRRGAEAPAGPGAFSRRLGPAAPHASLAGSPALRRRAGESGYGGAAAQQQQQLARVLVMMGSSGAELQPQQVRSVRHSWLRVQLVRRNTALLPRPLLLVKFHASAYSWLVAKNTANTVLTRV